MSMCARELSFHDEFVEVCVSFARELSFHDEFVEVCVSFPALLSHLARSATVESDGQLPDRQTVLRLAAVLHLACNVGKATGQGDVPPWCARSVHARVNGRAPIRCGPGSRAGGSRRRA